MDKTPIMKDWQRQSFIQPSEKSRLLGGDVGNCGQKSSQSETENRPTEYRFFVTMSIMLVFYRGSEGMASVTLKQFVYSWCLKNIVVPVNLTDSNDTDDHNATNECGSQASKATDSEAQKLASRWELYFNLLSAFLVFFSVCVYGTLSDFFGRKPFLCIALIGAALRCGIIATVIYFDLHITWILLAYGLDGFGGSMYAISVFVYTSTADVTRRSGGRVIASAAMETVLAAGSLSTQFGNGYFIHQYGYFYPMFTATCGMIFSALLTYVAHKETNENTKALSLRNQHCPPCLTLISRYTKFYLKPGEKSDRKVFWLCLAVFFLFEYSQQGRSDPLVLYQLGSPFCWSSEEIGWYETLSVLVCYVFACMLLKPLHVCLSSNTIACLGIVSAIGNYVAIGLAPSTLWIYLSIGFGLTKMYPKPVLRALASTKASEAEQGAMFAGLESSELICKMVSSPVSLSLYSATLGTMRGLLFLVLAGINGLALVIMIYLTYMLKRQSKQAAITVIQDAE